MNLQVLLDGMTKVKASDLHLKAGSPPVMRVNTQLGNVDHPKLTNEEIDETLQSIMPPRLRESWQEDGVIDFAYTLKNVGRYRVAAFHQRGFITVVIRRVDLKIPRLEDLNVPKAVHGLVNHHRGLILVTGITGSGKSSTLAAMLGEINRTRRSHIVTIEDPIEYLFEDQRSIVNQMEIGADCNSFRDVMSRVMRFDPDVVMVGEMRNRETVMAALEAADTGHLVMSTLHTSDSKQTVNRVLHFFPREMEELILEQLSLNLRAIISQRLIPRSDVKGLIPCCEVLINTPIVAKLIREGRVDEIQQALNSRDGDMQSFDMALALLVREEKISMENALQYSSDEASVRRMVRGEFSAGDKGGLIG